MKQAAAIFLLTIFSFNIFGYRIVYNYLAGKADTRLELALDKEAYDDADLISIKQPTNLPYYSNSKSFERLDGEVNINGTIYKYVKCRVYNDSLEMLCIPHVSKMKIQNAKDEFSKLVNDFQQGGNKKKTDSQQKHGKIIVAEFEELQNENTVNIAALTAAKLFFYNTPIMPPAFFKPAERPPDFSPTHFLS